MNTTQSIQVEVLPPEESTPLHPAPVAEIATINRYHQSATSAADEARSKAEEASHYALLAGTLLEDLRQSTPHGEWGKLFRDRRNLTSNAAQIGECAAFEFSSDAAARYIEVAKRIRLSRSMTTKAQKHLASIASAPSIDEDAREFLSKLTKGQTLRQLYLDLDIISSPAKEKPEKPEKPRIGKTEKQDRLEDAREAWFLWREQAEKMIKRGQLDDLDKAGLQQLKEFQELLRDRIIARLK